MTLHDVLKLVKNRRLDLSDGFIHVLSAALTWFDDGPVENLTIDQVGQMMRKLIANGKSSKTISNYRYAVFFLWGEAQRHGAPRFDMRECRPPKKVRRRPTAWTPEELAALIAACRMAPWKRGWGPPHWEALSLTIYDTSLRVGCLLRSRLENMDAPRRTLLIFGENQKGREETLQPLHESTVRLLLSIDRQPGDDRLFPWPFHRRLLWTHFEKFILARAGLPTTSRDKFHKIRRTSYTYVAVKHGIGAATEHAAHKSDLSAYYLDQSFLPKPNPLDALPRPA